MRSLSIYTIGVIRSASFQNPMARLALLAMLLLVLVPTFGRLAAGASSSPDAGWAALCTMTGLKYVALGADDDAPVPSQPAGIDGHCAYCPLLTTVAVFALWLAMTWPRRGQAPRSAWRPAPVCSRLHPCGLGSRGPPLAL